jgi:hypothetical protein
MDDELKRHMEAMEGRLMARINDVLLRLVDVRADVRNLRTEHSVTRDTVLKLPGTVLGAIEEPLLRRITAIETRVTKLDGEP